ncbi:Sporulation related domain-containing protein [Desulfacinum hydrothermale DSM 13146]|uniref:Sporulation related domain-containing protein n=1 Tax=Desulfacinum hydrothermale DSM 13146 TaxID=1121390 RepID=A0A1W1XV42_9BACT|nr:SPOR domain-containing protein [Desulfacinum hydrothermale]SMC27398.1 Sporulation related domain-containing protein [Desulfacinum hydrothermale DSM 13146]
MDRRSVRPQPRRGSSLKSGARRALLGRVFLALSLGIVFALLLSLLWRHNAQPPADTREPSPKQKLVKEVPKKAVPEPRVLPLGSQPAATESENSTAVNAPAAPASEHTAEGPSAAPETPPSPERPAAKAGGPSGPGASAPSVPAPQGATPAPSAESGPATAQEPDLQRAPAPGPGVTRSTAQTGYVVQVGAFKRKANADKLSRRLKAKGFSVHVTRFKHKSLGWLYLVRLRPMASQAEAHKAADKIAALEKTKPLVLKLPKAP